MQKAATFCLRDKALSVLWQLEAKFLQQLFRLEEMGDGLAGKLVGGEKIMANFATTNIFLPFLAKIPFVPKKGWQWFSCCETGR